MIATVNKSVEFNLLRFNFVEFVMDLLEKLVRHY